MLFYSVFLINAGQGRPWPSSHFVRKKKMPLFGVASYIFTRKSLNFISVAKKSKQYWLRSGVNKKLLIYWPLQEFYQSNCLCRESFKLSKKTQNFPAISGYTFSTPKLFTEYERTEDALSKITVLVNPARLFVEFTSGSFGA